MILPQTFWESINIILVLSIAVIAFGSFKGVLVLLGLAAWLAFRHREPWDATVIGLVSWGAALLIVNWIIQKLLS